MDLPPSIVAYLGDLTITTHEVAYLLVDRDGRLIRSGGPIASYGIESIARGETVEDRVGFLKGMLPMGDEASLLLAIEFKKGSYLDAHLIPDGVVGWVLLLNTTEDAAITRMIQQRGNELSLTRERLEREQVRRESLRGALDRTKQALSDERLGSQLLLSRLVPDSVAGRLLGGETNMAEKYPDAVVAWFSVRGMQQHARLDPSTQARRLAFVFETIEEMAAMHDVRWFKSVGLALVALIGAPESRPGAAAVGLELARRVAEKSRSRTFGPLLVTTALATGEVVAGVVGEERIGFEVWGAPVERAMTLAASVADGRIALTKGVRQALPAGLTLEARDDDAYLVPASPK